MGAWRLVALFGLLVLTSGCASVAKGVTEAIIESREDVDTRACHVDGPASEGLEVLLQEQERARATGESTRTMKVLMVHGISSHIPGYSARFQEHLMRELRLDVTEGRTKEITLRDPRAGEGPLGNLRISRYRNKAHSRELLFYELTWSSIADPEKKVIEFDSSGEYTFRRTTLNNAAKQFFNDAVPDVMIYLGEAQLPIQSSVRQSICWMSQGDWDYYADFMDESCDFASSRRIQQMKEDDYVFVTHSLGSRIVIDTVQYVAELAARGEIPQLTELREVLRQGEYPVYMLANQLPLLQLGRKPASVTGQIDAYCRPGGEHYEERMLGRLSIIAFSDPNDIMSYPIPPKFADEYLDSRMCPEITNITLNIAKVFSLFGFGEFANPLEAHSGYDHDDRVIALIAHGIGSADQAQIVTDRCTWMETAAE